MRTTDHRRARGTGEIRKVGNVYKIRYTLHGKRIQEKAGPRRKDAVELLNTRLGQVQDARLHPDAAKLQWSDVEAIILDEQEAAPQLREGGAPCAPAFVAALQGRAGAEHHL